MGSPLTKHHVVIQRLLILVEVLYVSTYIGWKVSPYLRGMLDAQLDYRHGHYEVKMYGGPLQCWRRKYIQLVDERYGVKIDWVAECDVPPRLKDYADGYNAVAWSHLRARFGQDISEFHDCMTEACETWKRQQPEE